MEKAMFFHDLREHGSSRFLLTVIYALSWLCWIKIEECFLIDFSTVWTQLSFSKTGYHYFTRCLVKCLSRRHDCEVNVNNFSRNLNSARRFHFPYRKTVTSSDSLILCVQNNHGQITVIKPVVLWMLLGIKSTSNPIWTVIFYFNVSREIYRLLTYFCTPSYLFTHVYLINNLNSAGASWCNGYRLKKWTRQTEFKSLTRLCMTTNLGEGKILT